MLLARPRRTFLAALLSLWLASFAHAQVQLCFGVAHGLLPVRLRTGREAALKEGRPSPRTARLAAFARSNAPRVSEHRQQRSLALGIIPLGLLVGFGTTRREQAKDARSRTAARATPSSDITGATAKLFSPAKINLFLRIIRRRPDNYHDLASLFHTVAFGDTLDLTVLPDTAERDELECNLEGVPVDDSNLVIRALNLFRERSGVRRFFHIKLEKAIPAQAGMGGGSSNAATAFFGANALCGSPASAADLLKWADDPIIGSDATFFLSEGTAYCTGRGEIVTPVAPLSVPDGLSVYLVKPRYGLSTPKVFKALDLSALSPVDPDELLKTFQEKGVEHSLWVNDLEKPAFEVCPELGDLKSFLADEKWGFTAVLMSGSGTTVYCIGDPQGGAAEFEAAVRERFDIEGIWQTQLMRRASADAWYSAPEGA